MDRFSTSGLLQLVPELGIDLAEEEFALASRLVLRVRAVDAGPADLQRLLAETNSFAAVLLEGVLTQRLQLWGQDGVRLLGPGDVIMRERELDGGMIECLDYATLEAARVVLLGDDLLCAAQRWPRLLSGLMVHLDRQSQRVTTQMIICQMPRVEDRVLAIMWLLSEVLGRVTPVGRLLSLRLTHRLIGELVGARRSTVTLAVNRLISRGALKRHQHGWLLLEHVCVQPIAGGPLKLGARAMPDVAGGRQRAA